MNRLWGRGYKESPVVIWLLGVSKESCPTSNIGKMSDTISFVSISESTPLLNKKSEDKEKSKSQHREVERWLIRIKGSSNAAKSNDTESPKLNDSASTFATQAKKYGWSSPTAGSPSLGWVYAAPLLAPDRISLTSFSSSYRSDNFTAIGRGHTHRKLKTRSRAISMVRLRKIGK